MDKFNENKNYIFTPLAIINIIIFLIVILSCFYFFYFKKDFNFIVEVECDPNREICFQRDCTDPNDCPPNGLSVFKRYELTALDFQYCENEDCKFLCENNKISCTLIKCEEDDTSGEYCSVLENNGTEIFSNETED